jgi:hypothetical protein
MSTSKKAQPSPAAKTSRRPSGKPTRPDDSAAAVDQTWQAMEREVEAMFAQIDRNLEAAANHLRAA